MKHNFIGNKAAWDSAARDRHTAHRSGRGGMSRATQRHSLGADTAGVSSQRLAPHCACGSWDVGCC